MATEHKFKDLLGLSDVAHPRAKGLWHPLERSLYRSPQGNRLRRLRYHAKLFTLVPSSGLVKTLLDMCVSSFDELP